ncbi:MAG: hypothetical protein ACXWQR_05185 [Ktedonobacterales bacterium]
MRQMEHEGELIWLRQSATFSVNGQTRTVEIAVPVRPDASAEEVEALMSQANMGMDALTRELDTRIAALLAGEAQHTAATNVTEAAQTRGAAAAASSAAPVALSAAATTPPAEHTPSARPASTAPTAAEAPAEAPAQAAPTRPQPTQTAPQQPAPARADASGPLRTPQPPAAAQPAAKPTPAPAALQKVAATAPVGPDISRAEFIAAAAEMGLNPGQAMERLGVRSLQGLNLREALEALRRQMVRDGGDATAMPAPTTPTTPPAQGARSAPATRTTSSASITPAPGAGRREAAPPQPPRYFEEEDDLEAADFTFTLDGEGDFYDEFGGVVDENAAGYNADGLNGASNEFGVLDDLEDIDLDEVPDFGPPPTPARTAPVMPVIPPTPAAPTAPRRATARANAAAPSAASAEEAAEPAEETPAMEGRSLGMQLVGQFRSVRGGGAPTGQQRMAYRNIVVRELGDGDARALVQGIWRVTPDRLGSEQLDALVSWGKRDTFAEEAALVLAMLQEERERNENAAPTEAEPPQAAPRANGAGPAAQRPAGRSRTVARPTPQAGDL